MASDFSRFRFWIWLIRVTGVIVPRRLRADWRQEWEAELRHREEMLIQWDRIDFRSKVDLFRRSTSAFWDAVWMQSYRWEDAMIQDLRFGIRLLLKNKSFTAVAVLSLALGIGANTSIFQLIDAVRLRTLPVKAPQELVEVRLEDRKGSRGGFTPSTYPRVTNPIWEQIRERQEAFSGVFAWGTDSVNLAPGGEVRSARMLYASGDFFNTLGVHPMFKQEGEKLTGTQSGGLGEAPVTGTIKGDKVAFTADAKNRSGEAIKITYTGTLESPTKMSGTLEFPKGPGKWTATRK
jgi:hypothetical protein